MKYILTALLLNSFISFSQTDLNLQAKYAGVSRYFTYIADDGSFVVRQANDNIPIMWSGFDPEGNKLFEKKYDMSRVDFYDPARKIWFQINVLGGVARIWQMDIDGKSTMTEIKNDALPAESPLISIDEKGILNMYFLRLGKDVVPTIFLRFNPADQTGEVITYKDVPGITGWVTFLGERENDNYFASLSIKKEGKKKVGVLVNVFAVSHKGSLRKIRDMEFLFKEEFDPFASVLIVKPLDGKYQNWEKNIYFSVKLCGTSNIGGKRKRDKIVHNVYKIDGEENLSEVTFTLPYQDVNSIIYQDPIYFVDKGTETALLVFLGETLKYMYISDFQSPQLLEPSSKGLYNEGYDEFLEVASQQRYAAFKICEGMARLVVISDKGVGTLYTQEEIK